MNLSPNHPQNKDLNQILQSYQVFAMNALGGPAHHWNTEMAKLASARFNAGLDYKRAIDNLQHKDKLALPFDFKSTFPSPAVPQKVPLFMKADSDCQLGEANLEGKEIACFTIGGEKRLCLPQVLNTVLSTFSLEDINQACDDLQIYCSRCKDDQLEIFKKANKLPIGAHSCGLITMTDAERLCSILLHAESMQTKSNIPQGKRFANEACIPVYHECFGSGYGYLKSALYEKPDSECIECADCGKVLSTRRFVGHSHGQQENRVCHWGFDRENWKCYILLDDEEMDEQEKDRLEKAFDEIINRFGDGLVVQNFSNSHGKRKESFSEGFSPVKLSRHQPTTESTITNKSCNANGYLTSPLSLTSNESICLKSVESPPAVVDPERIVSASHNERYEKNFAPNLELQRVEKREVSPTEKPLTEQGLSQREASPALSAMSSEHSIDDVKLALQSLDKMKGIFTTALATAGCSDELSRNFRNGFMSHLNMVKDFIDTQAKTDK